MTNNQLYNSKKEKILNNVINRIQKQLEELKIDSSEIVVFGSSVWEYFGLEKLEILTYHK